MKSGYMTNIAEYATNEVYAFQVIAESRSLNLLDVILEENQAFEKDVLGNVIYLKPLIYGNFPSKPYSQETKGAPHKVQVLKPKCDVLLESVRFST